MIGRASHCDVVIEEEFVSKQHLQVLRGIVLVDHSTNGTFVEGQRVEAPVLLGTRPASLAQSDITVRVEEEAAPVVASGLAEDVSAGLQAEIDGLQEKIRDLEQAKVALAAEAAAAVESTVALRQESESLRSKLAEVEQELALALAAPIPDKPVDDSPVSVLVFKLQRENAELKRALARPPQPAAAARAQSAPAEPAPAAVVPKPGALGAPPALIKGQKPTSMDIGSVVKKAGLPHSERAGAVNFERLAELVKLDADELPTRVGDALDAFLLTEGFRFLRRIEKVISRVASELIQLYQAQTLVPGVEGNLRDFLRSALADPDRTLVREGFLGYLREMGRWMVAALLAHRQAAEKFVEQLRDELSPEALMGEDAGVVAKKLSSKSEAELWRRAATHLRDLTSDHIRERIGKLARDAAEELVNKGGTQAFG